MPRAIAHPRDDILPETLPVSDVFDMGFLSLHACRAAPISARSRDYMNVYLHSTASGPDGTA